MVLKCTASGGGSYWSKYWWNIHILVSEPDQFLCYGINIGHSDLSSVFLQLQSLHSLLYTLNLDPWPLNLECLFQNFQTSSQDVEVLLSSPSSSGAMPSSSLSSSPSLLTRFRVVLYLPLQLPAHLLRAIPEKIFFLSYPGTRASHWRLVVK